MQKVKVFTVIIYVIEEQCHFFENVVCIMWDKLKIMLMEYTNSIISCVLENLDSSSERKEV